jgi:hypothetical protein
MPRRKFFEKGLDTAAAMWYDVVRQGGFAA